MDADGLDRAAIGLRDRRTGIRREGPLQDAPASVHRCALEGRVTIFITCREDQEFTRVRSRARLPVRSHARRHVRETDHAPRRKLLPAGPGDLVVDPDDPRLEPSRRDRPLLQAGPVPEDRVEDRARDRRVPRFLPADRAVRGRPPEDPVKAQ